MKASDTPSNTSEGCVSSNEPDRLWLLTPDKLYYVYCVSCKFLVRNSLLNSTRNSLWEMKEVY
jgi:hypothetical protein